MSQFQRTEMLIGKNSQSVLKNASVAVFGIGGVGSYVCEALARAGIGKFLLCDNDVVSESNINRQLIALHSSLGKISRCDLERIAVHGLDVPTLKEGSHSLHEVIYGILDSTHGNGSAIAALVVLRSTDRIIDLLRIIHAEDTYLRKIILYRRRGAGMCQKECAGLFDCH